MIRKPQSPVARICRRITELHFGMDATTVSKHHVQHYSGPNMKGCETWQQLKNFSCKKCVLSIFFGNNYLSVGGVVRNILRSPSGAMFVFFSPFEKIESFSNYPFSLCHLNLFTVSLLSTDIPLKQLDKTCCKYVLLPQTPQHF